MELIPAGGPSAAGLQLVLRSRRHIVVYDPMSEEMMLHTPEDAGMEWPVHNSAAPSPLSASCACPVCGRPWASTSSPNPSNDRDDVVHTAPHYFRLLSRALAAKGSSEHRGALRDVSATPPRSTHTLSDASTPRDSPDPSILSDTTNNTGYYERFFSELGRLGRGARGTVYLCQHVLNGHPLGTYAVKKIPVGDYSESLLRSLSEVHMMESLNHPNVIEYKHAWVELAQASPFTPRVPTLHVLMTAANGGSLADWIAARAGEADHMPSALPHVERLKAEFRARRGTAIAHAPGECTERTGVHFLREDEIVQLMRDITRGLTFLHDRGILHLDIKPGNVLLHWDDDQLLPTAKLSDFGSSLPLYEHCSHRRSGHTGTLEYMAPEAALRDARGRFAELSSKADVWSLGILFYLLMFFELPYAHVDDIDALRADIAAFVSVKSNLEQRGLRKRSASIHPRLLDLLNGMLQVEASARPLCRDILLVLDEYAINAETLAAAERRWTIRSSRRASSDHAPLQLAPRALPTWPAEWNAPPPRLDASHAVLAAMGLSYMQLLLAEHAWGSMVAMPYTRHGLYLAVLLQVAYAATGHGMLVGPVDVRVAAPLLGCVALLLLGQL